MKREKKNKHSNIHFNGMGKKWKKTSQKQNNKKTKNQKKGEEAQQHSKL